MELRAGWTLFYLSGQYSCIIPSNRFTQEYELWIRQSRRPIEYGMDLIAKDFEEINIKRSQIVSKILGILKSVWIKECSITN